jgi:hypothetical protein
MNLIEQWFVKKDFYEGVALLQGCGIDATTFEPYLNESFIPPQYKAALEACLSSISPALLSQPKTSNVVVQRPIFSENDAIQSLRQEAIVLHKRHADRHAQLHVLESAELRLPIILEIMENIIPALDEIYDVIRNGGIRKNLPHTEGGEPSLDYRQGIQDGFQQAQKLGYLKNRIFKLSSQNGFINKAKDRDEKLKFEKELIQKQTERNALCIELGITENE